MKLVTFTANGRTSYGAVVNGGVNFFDQALRCDLGFDVGRIFHDHMRHGFPPLIEAQLTAAYVSNMFLGEPTERNYSIPLVPAKAGTQIRQ